MFMQCFTCCLLVEAAARLGSSALPQILLRHDRPTTNKKLGFPGTLVPACAGSAFYPHPGTDRQHSSSEHIWIVLQYHLILRRSYPGALFPPQGQPLYTIANISHADDTTSASNAGYKRASRILCRMMLSALPPSASVDFVQLYQVIDLKLVKRRREYISWISGSS
jgi:hypothetical protein